MIQADHLHATSSLQLRTYYAMMKVFFSVESGGAAAGQPGERGRGVRAEDQAAAGGARQVPGGGEGQLPDKCLLRLSSDQHSVCCLIPLKLVIFLQPNIIYYLRIYVLHLA